MSTDNLKSYRPFLTFCVARNASNKFKEQYLKLKVVIKKRYITMPPCAAKINLKKNS